MENRSDADVLQQELYEKALKLAALRKNEPGIAVDDYMFNTLDGAAQLSDLFAGRDRLLMIHNMGQGCRYCTLWADGINGVLPHLEDAMAVALASKDDPETQRRFAADRGWRFRMASHGGGPYMREQVAMMGHDNFPGAAVFERRDGMIFRMARAPFGPGDLFSPVWHFLSLAGIDQEEWTPQFHYWSRPRQLDDGGENVRD